MLQIDRLVFLCKVSGAIGMASVYYLSHDIATALLGYLVVWPTVTLGMVYPNGWKYSEQ